MNTIIASDNNFDMKITVKSSMQSKEDEGTVIGGIDNHTTVLDIKKLLQTSEVISIDEQLLCPIFKKWWNFGLFPFQGAPLINNNELIKNIIKYYKTNIFYLSERKKQ